MIRMNAAKIAEIVSGKLNVDGAAEIWLAPVFDSRKATPGSFFLALKGENEDGHDYAASAIGNGAVFALVTQEVSVPYILVSDVYKALAALAKYVRDQLIDLKVIGITGSQGKTTTKDLLFQILSSVVPQSRQRIPLIMN
jgi:UDP-N-acetylmuramoyl-tripeptide--D-alanyl-D-alanine ligase